MKNQELKIQVEEFRKQLGELINKAIDNGIPLDIDWHNDLIEKQPSNGRWKEYEPTGGFSLSIKLSAR